jgi:vanadium-dependent haloperoxidase-like protein
LAAGRPGRSVAAPTKEEEMSKLRLPALVAALAAAFAWSFGGTARADVPNPVLAWDDAAAQTVVKSGAFQNEGFIYMAYVSSAIDNAVRAASPSASVDAAAIEAAYDTLNNYFPLPRKAGTPDLEALYTSSLAAIPNGAAKTAGIALGAQAAADEIAARTGDGRMTPIGVTSTFPTLPPGPGVWRYPPGVTSAQTPWVANVRPFVLTSADQFLPPPPPPLTSERWVKAFDEVKADGTGADPAKAAVARFWTANVILQENETFRDVAGARALDTTAAARLMAMVNVVASDAQISVMYAKYHYLFWRPVTAIDPTSVSNDGFGPVPGYDDGNPKTVEQVGWRPLLAVPNHPEYPAAHGSITGAMAELWRLYLGTKDVGLTIHGGPALDQTRTFATVDDLNDEIVNARIWGGLHYRFSGDAGVMLGTKVARYDLQNGFGLGG